MKTSERDFHCKIKNSICKNNKVNLLKKKKCFPIESLPCINPLKISVESKKAQLCHISLIHTWENKFRNNVWWLYYFDPSHPICRVPGLHRVPLLLLPQHGGAEHPEASLAALADGQVDQRHRSRSEVLQQRLVPKNPHGKHPVSSSPWRPLHACC
jgi:hypothetical protein